MPTLPWPQSALLALPFEGFSCVDRGFYTVLMANLLLSLLLARPLLICDCLCTDPPDALPFGARPLAYWISHISYHDTVCYGHIQYYSFQMV